VTEARLIAIIVIVNVVYIHNCYCYDHYYNHWCSI